MKHLIWIFLFLTVVSRESGGQEGNYCFGPNSKPVEQLEDAVTYKEVKRRSAKKYKIGTYHKLGDQWVRTKKEKIKIQGSGSQTIFYNASSLFPKRIYREMEEISPGEYLFKESTLTSTVRTGTSTSFLPLHLEGVVTEYHPNGAVKSKSVYNDNQLISNENWLNDGSKYIDTIFYSVDKEPEYQMGDDFFKGFLINKIAESKLDLTQIEDQVVIGWVVMENGKINGVIALKGKSRQLNQLLVNTIMELPGYWTPAILDGKKVRYFMSIPLNFMQREANFQDIEFSSGVMHYNRY
ncbi:MAG: hypothetical protein ABFS38_17265 [Bacteroidota bacterium]